MSEQFKVEALIAWYEQQRQQAVYDIDRVIIDRQIARLKAQQSKAL